MIEEVRRLKAAEEAPINLVHAAKNHFEREKNRPRGHSSIPTYNPNSNENPDDSL